MTWTADEQPVPHGWTVSDDGGLQLAVVDPWGSVTATAPPEWTRTLLRLPHSLERTPEVSLGSEEDPGDWPGAGLPAPFEAWMVRPRPSVWEGLRARTRRGTTVMLAEAGVFTALLVVVVFLLRATLRREAELERRHENFLSSITHERRSPLASMRLSLETILRGRADSTASVRFLSNALQDAERLQSLVEKVLEVTRFGLGAESMRLHRGSLSETVNESLDAFLRRPMFTGARIDRKLTGAVWVEHDEEAFDIVITNLL